MENKKIVRVFNQVENSNQRAQIEDSSIDGHFFIEECKIGLSDHNKLEEGVYPLSIFKDEIIAAKVFNMDDIVDYEVKGKYIKLRDEYLHNYLNFKINKK